MHFKNVCHFNHATWHIHIIILHFWCRHILSDTFQEEAKKKAEEEKRKEEEERLRQEEEERQKREEEERLRQEEEERQRQVSYGAVTLG